jgi:hypothetical protein
VLVLEIAVGGIPRRRAIAGPGATWTPNAADFRVESVESGSSPGSAVPGSPVLRAPGRSFSLALPTPGERQPKANGPASNDRAYRLQKGSALTAGISPAA